MEHRFSEKCNVEHLVSELSQSKVRTQSTNVDTL